MSLAEAGNAHSFAGNGQDAVLEHKLCVFVGLPRTASTFLHFTFQQHPEVFVTSRKELDYFSLNYARGRDWYESLFEDSHAAVRCFDVSPNYSLHPQAHERIAAFSSTCPVVLILRDPVDWAISFFHMTKLILQNKDSLTSMLHNGYIHRRDGEELHVRFYPGMFRDIVERYQQTFGSRLLLCDFRMMHERPLELLQAIEKHTELTPFFTVDNFENVKINRGGQRSILSRGLNYLAMQPMVLTIVERTLPRPAIQWLKNTKERLSARSSTASTPEVSEQDRREAEAFFADDVSYVASLFEQAPVLVDGQPAQVAGGDEAR